MRSRIRTWIGMLAALMMVLTGTLFVHADGQTFSDVPADSWFYEDVAALVDSGVVSGYPDGTYRPGNYVTTGEALKMILLAAGYPEPETVSSHWARGYLNYAIDQGFLVRYEDISDLDVNMTRALVAKLAANALNLTSDGAAGTFTDTDSSYVRALYIVGIVGGYPDGTFRPNAGVTRAELAAIVHRIYTYRDTNGNGSDQITMPDGETVQLRSSEALVAFVKAKEGFRATAYWDYAQYSIGYGSACTKDEYPSGITQEQADLLLRQMLHNFEEKLDTFLTDNFIILSDNEYDALVSLSYNIGTDWMKSSTLATFLKTGRYTHNEIASAIGIWCHVTTNGTASIHDGLISRRIAEINMFLYGDYSGADTGFYWLKFNKCDGDRERDIAFYEAGSTYDPFFVATSSTDTFAGWFTDDGQQITRETVVTQNLTVSARWAGETGSTDTDLDDGSGYDDFWG